MAVAGASRFPVAAALALVFMAGPAMGSSENAKGTFRLEFGGGVGRPELAEVKQAMQDRIDLFSGYSDFSITSDPLGMSSMGPVGSIRFGGMLSKNFGLGIIGFGGSSKIKADATYTESTWDSYWGWYDYNYYNVETELANSYVGAMLQIWIEGGNIPGPRFHFGLGGGLARITSIYSLKVSEDTFFSGSNAEYSITYGGTAPALLGELGIDFWATRNFSISFAASYLKCSTDEMTTTGESTGDISSVTANQPVVDRNGDPLEFDLSGPQFTIALKFGFGYSGKEEGTSTASRRSSYAEEAPRERVKLAPGEKVKNIAVSTLDAQNVSAGDAAVIADLLRSELVKSGAFNVVEKANMDKVLSEQGFQQSGCTSEECAVKLGKLLNVQRMIVGSFGKLMGRYFINLRVVDVETGQVIFSDKAKGDTVDDIEAGVAKVTDSICREAR